MSMKELLLTIDVLCKEPVSVKGGDTEITMVPFTGKAHGECFNGETVGEGMDTQRLDRRTGKFTLSARYMLEGTDREGNRCRVFIDNSTRGDGGLHPAIVTDSPLLADRLNAPLTADVEGSDGGVTVRIYREARKTAET